MLNSWLEGKTKVVESNEEIKYPIRILNIVSLMSPGGIEMLIMNIYRNIDRNKVQFDFLTHKGINGVFDDEIYKLGGRIYKMPKLRDGEKTYYWKFFEYKKALKQFFREHPEYHIIHGHMTNTAIMYMPIAKKYGQVTCCIAHSHKTQVSPDLGGLITSILQKPLYHVADEYFACSEAAAKWIYPQWLIDTNRVKVIKNGVDPSRFNYDEDKAREIKNRLGLEGMFVIGNVARFKVEKNHDFMIDIFQEIHQMIDDAVLLLIGEGELMEQMKEKVSRLNLDGYVKFLGLRSDVSDLMLAMDLFILPSLTEGLPVVAIEAQASGLPVVTSTGVPTETDITGNVTFLDLSIGAKSWAEKIIDVYKNFNRHDMNQYIKENGYDITETAAWLQEFYLAYY